MKVRIRTTPREREVDGVDLDRLAPGSVRDVAPPLAAWLIVEGYAEPEMRRSESDYETPPSVQLPGGYAHDRRRRR